MLQGTDESSGHIDFMLLSISGNASGRWGSSFGITDILLGRVSDKDILSFAVPTWAPTWTASARSHHVTAQVTRIRSDQTDQ